MSAKAISDTESVVFWDRFEKVIPEAVLCRFFALAMGVANGRLKEYRRESGPYLEALRKEHLPCAIRRSKTLKDAAEGLASFEDDRDDFRAVDDPFQPAFAFTSKFEQEILDLLEQTVTSGNEDQAQQTVESLKKIAEKLLEEAKAQFAPLVTRLEAGVVKSILIRSGEEPKFVSCVSLDLAQYGRHSKVLDGYLSAKGVFNLNRRIQDGIQDALKANGVPGDRFVVIDTGDGALVLVMSTATEVETSVVEWAFKFSQSFLKEFTSENSSTETDNQLHFRVGIASGFVELEQVRIPSCGVAQCHAGGMTLGTAVRLQSSARTGEIVVCANTWRNLPSPLQKLFAAEEDIFGKVHEKTPIAAHRFSCTPPWPGESNPKPTV